MKKTPCYIFSIWWLTSPYWFQLQFTSASRNKRSLNKFKNIINIIKSKSDRSFDLQHKISNRSIFPVSNPTGWAKHQVQEELTTEGKAHNAKPLQGLGFNCNSRLYCQRVVYCWTELVQDGNRLMENNVVSVGDHKRKVPLFRKFLSWSFELQQMLDHFIFVIMISVHLCETCRLFCCDWQSILL